MMKIEKRSKGKQSMNLENKCSLKSRRDGQSMGGEVEPRLRFMLFVTRMNNEKHAPFIAIISGSAKAWVPLQMKQGNLDFEY